MTGTPLIDCDMHLYEPRTMWRDHADPRDRDLALRIEEDARGHAWLVLGDRPIHPAEVYRPGDVELTGAERAAIRAGERAPAPYDERLPEHYWHPGAAAAHLDELGVDEAVGFPNHGLLWERPVAAAGPRATEVNMGSWNRWAVDVAAGGGGRLHPVAHLSLHDLGWLEAQLGDLAAGGVRLAMVAPALVDGRPLSHPDLDRAWSLFVDHGVTPCFHVGAFPPAVDPAWHHDDVDVVNPVLSTVLLWVPAALALSDLSVHGVLDRHPALRIGVMELSATWTAGFFASLDGCTRFHARQNGLPVPPPGEGPGARIVDHVRVAAFPTEGADRLTGAVGDVFMFCSDYPHGEGTATPLADYARLCGPELTPERAPGFFGGNVAWLLRREADRPIASPGQQLGL